MSSLATLYRFRVTVPVPSLTARFSPLGGRSLTVNDLAAVERDDRAGHERGDRAQQQRDPARHLVRRADAAERDLALQPPVRLREIGGPGGMDRGVDGAGRDAVDPDAVPGEFAGQGLG